MLREARGGAKKCGGVWEEMRVSMLGCGGRRGKCAWAGG